MTTTIDYSDNDIDIHELLRHRRQVALIWSVKDVRDVRPDLTDDQAWKVLMTCDHRQTSYWGITCDFIEYIAEGMFPEDVTQWEEQGDRP